MATLVEILQTKIGKHGKSKAYVATQLNVSEKTIENYMNGKRSPKPGALIKLSEILGFSLSELSEHNGHTTKEQDVRAMVKDPNAVPYSSDKDKLITRLESLVDVSLSDLREKLGGIEETLKRLEEKMDRTEVAAPERGFVRTYKSKSGRGG